MELKILGSSSSGNGYAFITSDNSQILLWEAGVPIYKVKQAIGFQVSKVVGCIGSHIHLDHFGRVKEYLASGIDIYASKGTIEAKGIKHHRLHEISAGNKFHIGNFTIMPFDVVHDCPEPLGFLIHHQEMGTTLALTDSFYSEYKFRGLNNILLEVNYDPEILESRSVHKSLKDRIRLNHMSIETAIELLKANDLSNVNNIVLLHLSDSNSHADNFKSSIEKVTGKTVTIADRGVSINLDKTPF